MANVTELLLRWGRGDQDALDEIVPVLYQELKRLARARLSGEPEGHTLNTTGLVHEAYLRLVDVDRVEWNDRNHFLSMAARTMRRILIDHARRRGAAKREGRHVDLDEGALLVSDEQSETLLELEGALERLEAEHPRPSQVLDLCYFGGFTQDEMGELLGVAQPTVSRDLRFAKVFLSKELGAG